jgi:hypothetical protein
MSHSQRDMGWSSIARRVRRTVRPLVSAAGRIWQHFQVGSYGRLVTIPAPGMQVCLDMPNVGRSMRYNIYRGVEGLARREPSSSLCVPQAAGIGFRKEPDTWILRRHRTARRMDGCLPSSLHWARTPNSPRAMSLRRSCVRQRLSDSIPQRSRHSSRRLAPEKPTNPLAFRHPESRWRHSALSRLRKRKVIRFQWKS